jgi:enoyl-CoA hydratase
MPEQIALEHNGPISTIVLDKPSRHNALTLTMIRDLARALQDADDEPSTQAILLTGAGEWFCAGIDFDSASLDAGARVHNHGWHLVYQLLEVEKPIVAMLNGPAVGLGLALALLCDSVIMSEDAYLADNSIELGFVAGDGAALVLPLLIGPHRAKEMLLSGMKVGGARAAALGLVNRSVAAKDLRTKTYELAALYAEQPQYAVRATKLVVNRYIRWMAHQVLDIGMAYQAVSRKLPDYAAATPQRARYLVGEVGPHWQVL